MHNYAKGCIIPFRNIWGKRPMTKIIIILLALTLMAFAFAGCSGSTEALKVAVDDTYPPMK